MPAGTRRQRPRSHQRHHRAVGQRVDRAARRRAGSADSASRRPPPASPPAMPRPARNAGGSEHAADDVAAGGADRHANRELAPPVRDVEADQAEQSQHRQRERQRREQREHPRAESPRRDLLVHDVVEHHDAADQHARIALPRLRLDRRGHRQRVALLAGLQPHDQAGGGPDRASAPAGRTCRAALRAGPCSARCRPRRRWSATTPSG